MKNKFKSEIAVASSLRLESCHRHDTTNRHRRVSTAAGASGTFRRNISAIIKIATALFNFTFLILNCSAQLTPIEYNASDFTGATNNLPVTLTSLQRLRINNQTMLVGLPISFTPTNGAWTTNIYPGLYNLTIQGIPAGLTCLVPAATNLQTLASCVISNMGLFSASNLNALITNEVFILGGTNIQVTTNGFTYTINGLVTNLTGLTISNGTFYGSFTGNGGGLSGVQPTNSTLTWLGLYPTNSIAYTIQLNALSNAIPAGNISGVIPVNNGGTGNASGYAQALTNGIAGYNIVVLTNVGGSPAFYVQISQSSLSNLSANNFLGVISSSSSRNGNGIWFHEFGTNVTGFPFSTSTNPFTGLVETNYIQTYGNAAQIGVNGAQATTNILAGFYNIWAADLPFAIASFSSGNHETAGLVFTNGFWYWLPPQSTNYDGSGDGYAKATVIIDQIHTNVAFTNLARFGVSSQNFNLDPSGALRVLNVNAVINYPLSDLTVTNLTITQAGNTGVQDYVPLITIANAGGSGGGYASQWIFGLRDDTKRSLYVGNAYQLFYQMDGDASIFRMMIPFGGATATFSNTLTVSNETCLTITVTNSPTFSHTNTAPGNATTPVLWIDVTNGSSVYRMPLYQ